MPAVLYFILLLILVIVAGPLFAYPLYKGLQSLTDIEFHKVIGHTTLLCGLIFSFIYLKLNRLNYKTGFGYNLPSAVFLRQLLGGTGTGILIMFLLVLFLFLSGVYQAEDDLDLSWQHLLKLFLTAVVSGFAVGFIEESIFRGALISGLYKQTNALTTVFLTSLVFAAVHFIKYPKIADHVELNWLTGIETLPAALSRFTDPVIVDSFLTLFTLGVLLALIRLRNGNIAQSIGVHAGIVMMIKLTGDFTDYNPMTRFACLVNDHNHLLGYLAFSWLVLLCTVYYFLAVKNKSAVEQNLTA